MLQWGRGGGWKGFVGRAAGGRVLLVFVSFPFFLFVFVFCDSVFATNFRVKAAMKNSILLSWEIRDKNPTQPFTVSQLHFRCVIK